MQKQQVRMAGGLLREFVRTDLLKEFFSRDWGNHFSNHGPIKGVKFINVKSPSFLEEVADRVKQIRNRIVDTKDDPRYQEARVVLPRSHEAHSLWPDVELMRFLASGAILTGQ